MLRVGQCILIYIYIYLGFKIIKLTGVRSARRATAPQAKNNREMKVFQR